MAITIAASVIGAVGVAGAKQPHKPALQLRSFSSSAFGHTIFPRVWRRSARIAKVRAASTVCMAVSGLSNLWLISFVKLWCKNFWKWTENQRFMVVHLDWQEPYLIAKLDSAERTYKGLSVSSFLIYQLSILSPSVNQLLPVLLRYYSLFRFVDLRSKSVVKFNCSWWPG